MQDARFAWTCVKHVKSNAITIAKQGRLLGMGSGQPNRVKSTQIALEKADKEAKVILAVLLCLHLLCAVVVEICEGCKQATWSGSRLYRRAVLSLVS